MTSERKRWPFPGLSEIVAKMKKRGYACEAWCDGEFLEHVVPGNAVDVANLVDFTEFSFTGKTSRNIEGGWMIAVMGNKGAEWLADYTLTEPLRTVIEETIPND